MLLTNTVIDALIVAVFFWLKDESLEDTDNLPAPHILAAEIVEQLQAALDEFKSVEEVLAGNGEAE